MCMESALALLDEAKAPLEVGAYVDMAICRLREHMPGLGEVQSAADTSNRKS